MMFMFARLRGNLMSQDPLRPASGKFTMQIVSQKFLNGSGSNSTIKQNILRKCPSSPPDCRC